jgi:acyl transferase domain-containing protein
LFSRAGSQYLNMGSSSRCLVRAVQDTWERDARAPLGHGEPALHEVVYPKPVFDARTLSDNEARLQRTEWAHAGDAERSVSPRSRFCKSSACNRAAVAGHSFGEVSALCAAGVVSSARPCCASHASAAS